LGEGGTFPPGSEDRADEVRPWRHAGMTDTAGMQRPRHAHRTTTLPWDKVGTGMRRASLPGCRQHRTLVLSSAQLSHSQS
jgi:hypothetical protein